MPLRMGTTIWSVCGRADCWNGPLASTARILMPSILRFLQEACFPCHLLYPYILYHFYFPHSAIAAVFYVLLVFLANMVIGRSRLSPH